MALIQEPVSSPYKKASIALIKRLRRNRQSPAIRSLLRETSISKTDLVMPLFLVEGTSTNLTNPCLPGVYRLSLDLSIRHIERLHRLGIQAFALFPVVPKEKKSLDGKEVLNPNSLLLRGIREIKKAIPSICLITDVALDPFTSHGHDGLASEKGEILNDETLYILGKASILQAEAGADIVAPSDMMDGRIQYIRSALDQEGFTMTGILSYAAKYSSCFYGPFRDVLQSHVLFGDKKTYQMDPGNQREAILEAILDIEEGADILMVKPAHTYLDVISKIKETTLRPLAAYHVSGEYSMIRAAAEKGYIDSSRAFYEILLGIKRAGADFIFTYAIEEVLPLLDS